VKCPTGIVLNAFTCGPCAGATGVALQGKNNNLSYFRNLPLSQFEAKIIKLPNL